MWNDAVCFEWRSRRKDRKLMGKVAAYMPEK